MMGVMKLIGMLRLQTQELGHGGILSQGGATGIASHLGGMASIGY